MTREVTGAGAPRWNAEAAELLRTQCGLTGAELGRNLAWWKRVRATTSDETIRAAILGLRSVMRVEKPWRPYAVFGKRGCESIFGEAASAYYKAQTRGPRKIDAAIKDFARGLLE